MGDVVRDGALPAHYRPLLYISKESKHNVVTAEMFRFYPTHDTFLVAIHKGNELNDTENKSYKSKIK